jgi:hypothetical protein
MANRTPAEIQKKEELVKRIIKHPFQAIEIL